MLGTTIGQQLEIQTEKTPDKEAVVFCAQDIRRTFQELMAEVDKLASGFLSLGMQRGDRIGIWGPNSYEWVLTMFASARIGCTLVNVNPLYTVRELDYVMKKVGVKAIVASEKFKDYDYYSMLNAVSDSCPDLKHIIMMGNGKYPGTFRFNDLLEDNINKTIQDLQHEIQFDDRVNIQFTSGTTGSPKGVILSHHGILNNAYFIGRTMGYQEEDARICVPVPLYHCFGCVMAALQLIVHGSCNVYPSPSFESLSTIRAVDNERCTVLYGVPTMFIDILAHPDLNKYHFSSLRIGIMGGSLCPIEVLKQVLGKLNMKEIMVAYGMTECSPVSFLTARDDPLEIRVSTIGQPGHMTEAKLIDETGKIVPVGVHGEICTRGYNSMLGYWGEPEQTAEVITPARWLHSGDIGVMNEDGYCKIVGRSKEMIIRGGENIYPTEIEAVMHQHPKVKDVQVFGVPHDRLGEEVCAYIKLAESNCTVEELTDFCREKLARFKVPKYMKFVDSYPLTVTGKVQKFMLRETAAKELGLSNGK